MSCENINTLEEQHQKQNQKTSTATVPFSEHKDMKEIFRDEYPFIGIAGIIASGKSTLTKNLTETLEKEFGVPFRAYYEHVEDNPYLDNFYKALDAFYKIPDSNLSEAEKEAIRYRAHLEAFGMETYLLNERYIDHKKIQWNLYNAGAVQDRTIFEDSIFVKMLHEDGVIRKVDMKANLKAYDIKAKHFQKPDLIIYLEVEPEVAHARLKKRNRDEESSVSLSYLARLKQEYEKWREQSRDLNIQVVDWNKDNQDIHFMVDLVRDHYIR